MTECSELQAAEYVDYANERLAQGLEPIDYKVWLNRQFMEYQEKCDRAGLCPMDFWRWSEIIEVVPHYKIAGEDQVALFTLFGEVVAESGYQMETDHDLDDIRTKQTLLVNIRHFHHEARLALNMKKHTFVLTDGKVQIGAVRPLVSDRAALTENFRSLLDPVMGRTR